MGDGHPGTTHLRPERRREAGVPVHRGEEQLIERASVHCLNSTTKVTVSGTSVPFTCRMVAVTTTESGTVLPVNRTRVAASPELVNTVSFGTNVTTELMSGKMVKA